MKFKKAAMFGLESRALKKQFGKLFLVRMQSVDSQETRGASIQSNRAAMFGLDARIALAIFGALSVISGAALYSAIQNSKAVSIIAQLNEVLKATEAYMIDTGADLPYDTTSATYRSQILSLVSNTELLRGWNGPYLPYSAADVDTTSEDFIKVNGYNLYTGYYQQDVDSLGGWTDFIKACEAGKPCFAVSAFSRVPESLLGAIDLQVDGADTPDSGKLRYYKAGAGSWVWLIGAPKLSQP